MYAVDIAACESMCESKCALVRAINRTIERDIETALCVFNHVCVYSCVWGCVFCADNARDFCKWLKEKVKKSKHMEPLEGLLFAVFGLGDRSYIHTDRQIDEQSDSDSDSDSEKMMQREIEV